MEIQQLQSEILGCTTPETAEQLYVHMTATALDFRALDVPEDWLDQLWDLALDVHKLIPEAVSMRDEDQAQFIAEMLPNLKRMGVTMKSRSRMSREERQKEAELDRLRRRLLQIRQNAWHDIKPGSVDINLYRSAREDKAKILQDRLQHLETLLPTPTEAAQAASGYLEAMTFWQTLERPSTPAEQERGLDAMVRTRLMTKRAKRYYSERDQVIFLWNEPVIQMDASEEDEIRDNIISMLESYEADEEDT